jgi:hypothetical protein
MIRLFRRLMLFSLPFWVYAIFVGATDPFNFFSRHSLISEQIKEKTAALINPPLWKMNQFSRTPFENILLGDSRMGHLPTREIHSVSGQKYFDFSYGGASLREIVDTFWFAEKHAHLKNVVIGVNFSLYNERNVAARAGTYSQFCSNRLLYFVDHSVVKASILGAYADWFNQDLTFGVPRMSRQEFWESQLQKAERMYSSYERPKRYRAELGKITAYCQKNSLKCSFIIFPTHIDLQRLVETARLNKEYQEFKCDLARMTVTYDYDYQNDLTANASNFADPFHFTDSVGGELVREIWTNRLQYGRQLHADSLVRRANNL